MATKAKKSFAEVIMQAQLMTTGLKNQSEAVAKRGIDADFISAMEKKREEAIALNEEQERLKAELKTKTDQLNNKLEELLSDLSESRKLVKIAIPQVGWKEFGIEDKR